MQAAAPNKARTFCHSHADDQFSVEIAEDWRAFAGEWPSISDAGPWHVFQTREFLDVWLETIGAARRVRPVFVRVQDRRGATIMLAPLCVETRRGARVLTFMDGGVSDYNIPILLNAGALSPGLWRRVCTAAGAIDAVSLEKMPLAAGAMQAQVPPAHNVGYCIPLDGDFNAYVSTRLHRPKDSRRKRRHMERAGGARFIVAETADEVARLYAAMVEQKTRRYALKNAQGFERPGYRRYFAAMTERLHRRGAVNLSAYEVGGEILATQWGLVAGDTFYCLMLAFADHPLTQYSPARLLVEDLVAWSYSRGLRRFDLGAGEAAWKPLLGAERAPLFATRYPVTPMGWFYDAAVRAKRAVRRGRSTQPDRALV